MLLCPAQFRSPSPLAHTSTAAPTCIVYFNTIYTCAEWCMRSVRLCIHLYMLTNIPDLAQLCLHRQHHFPDGRAITRTLSISPPPALLGHSLSAVRQPPWSFTCCFHPPPQVCVRMSRCGNGCVVRLCFGMYCVTGVV